MKFLLVLTVACGLLLVVAVVADYVGAAPCYDKCPIQILCNGQDAECPECFGLGIGEPTCSDFTAYQYNPANIVIRRREESDTYTGKTAQFQDEVICWRSALCSWGPIRVGELCSGLSQLCLPAPLPIPAVYCTPCGVHTAWSIAPTYDYHCTTEGCDE